MFCRCCGKLIPDDSKYCEFCGKQIINSSGEKISVNEKNNVITQNQIDCMDTVDLKEYLDIVVNMEKNIYLQNRLIFQKKNRFTQLGQAHTYQKPVAPKDVSGIFRNSIITRTK